MANIEGRCERYRDIPIVTQIQVNFPFSTNCLISPSVQLHPSKPVLPEISNGTYSLTDFRFHDLRPTFASWYMMNGGDLYELAKILGHSNIKMTERYAKLAKHHIARTSNTAREMWKLLEPIGAKQAVG